MVQDNELLYDKGHCDYKLTEKKTAMWKEKAEELGVCDGPRLKCWIDSLRTQYGKLTKKPSGSGARMSDRDKWILDKFSFSSRHIYRIPSRGGVDLMAKNREKHPDRVQDANESDEGGESGEDSIPSISPAMSVVSGETDVSVAKIGKKKANKDDTSSFIKRLNERIEQSGRMQDKLLEQMVVPTDQRAAERRQWAQWFGAAISGIDDALWSEFQAESLQLVNTFKARSKRLQPVNAVSTYTAQSSAAPQSAGNVKLKEQERADLQAAMRLQQLNYSSTPGGYLPKWQHAYQPPPRSVFPPLPPLTRPYSVPLSSTATLASQATASVLEASCHSYGMGSTLQNVDVNTGGQNDTLGELMSYSGIDSPCDSDSDDV